MGNQILDNLEEDNKGKKFESLSELIHFFRSLNKRCQQQLDEGKPKSEIFSKLISENGTRYQKRISRSVGFAISSQQETENKLVIQVLIVLQIIVFIGQLLIGYTFYSMGGSWSGLFFSVGIMLWIDVFILRRLYKKRLEVLPLISMISAFRLFGIYSDIGSFEYGNWIYAYGLALLTSMIISFWLKKKLFPNFGFFGPKKGEFEKYKF